MLVKMLGLLSICSRDMVVGLTLERSGNEIIGGSGII